MMIKNIKELNLYLVNDKELNLLLARDKELFCNRWVKNCSFLLSDKKINNSFFLIDTKVIVIRTKNKENNSRSLYSRNYHK